MSLSDVFASSALFLSSSIWFIFSFISFKFFRLPFLNVFWGYSLPDFLLVSGFFTPDFFEDFWFLIFLYCHRLVIALILLLVRNFIFISSFSFFFLFFFLALVNYRLGASVAHAVSFFFWFGASRDLLRRLCLFWIRILIFCIIGSCLYFFSSLSGGYVPLLLGYALRRASSSSPCTMIYSRNFGDHLSAVVTCIGSFYVLGSIAYMVSFHLCISATIILTLFLTDILFLFILADLLLHI